MDIMISAVWALASEAYVSYLASKGIAQSMDGKGRWADNVIVERLCA